MTYRHEVFSAKSTVVGALLLFAACSSGSGGLGTGGARTSTGGQAGQSATGGMTASGGNGSAGTTGAGGSWNSGGQASSSKTGGTSGSSQGGTTSTGGATGSGGQTGGAGGQAAGAGGTVRQTGGSGGQAAGAGGTVRQTGGSGGQATSTGGRQTGGSTLAGTGGTGAGGQSGGASGRGGSTGTGGQTGGPGIDGGLTSACVGKEFPTANPTSAGPFEITAEKKVGPLAGYIPDPIYGDEQQRFNIYRPKNLADGYCHPILVWSNGHTDNPEQNPPKCVVDSAANKWCGQYLPVLNHLASHGFVVIASLSTTTSKGDPLPSIVGLNWLLEQAEDPANATYYHRLDTAHIGALGHSEGGMATCMMAKDPRFTAIATVSGTSTITGLHGPALFFCGGREGTNGSVCDNIQKVASGITDQPSMLINNLNADHGSWAYEGASGVDISGLAAWFRLHLMGDTAQRKRFFGESCTFCTDSRVKVYRNSLMNQ